MNPAPFNIPSSSRVSSSFRWLILLVPLLLTGCWQSVLDACALGLQTCQDEPDGGMGGLVDPESDPSQLSVVDLPFPEGWTSFCTQGPHDPFSHNLASTRYAVDLDTPNNRDEGIYAPVSGTVYVHGSPMSTSGFGYHLHIEMESDRFLVLAHLADIVVNDGDEVVEGQFLGMEGCTGWCTGDHVHVSVMEGRAHEPSQEGYSVPFALFTRDVAVDDMPGPVFSGDFVCGEEEGHAYESFLETVSWHPDGTLLSVPGDTDVYAVDQGRLHRFENEAVLAGYGFHETQVVPMSPHEQDCWEMGSSIAQPTCYRAVQEGPSIWLAYECEDNPGRYRLPVPMQGVTSVLASWGITSVEPPHSDLGEMLLSYPEGTGTARLRDGALVREHSNSTVYAVNEGVALPIFNWEVLLSMNLLEQEIFVLPDGALTSAVLGVGFCPDHPSCIDAQRVRQCGGSIDVSSLADGGTGGLNGLPDGPSEPDPCQSDTDGDGVADCEDTCPLHDNADQHDQDGDGLGDSCDFDIDGDGVENSVDCAPFDAGIGLCPESSCDDGADNDQDGYFDCNDTDCADTVPCEDQGDDDDDTSDDDDATPEPFEGDDDDATEEPPVEGDDDDVTEVVRPLRIHYTPPALLAPYTYIELSGEYLLADGSVGIIWTSGLATAVNASSLTFELPGALSGDTFRFSLEFYDAATSYLSWGCLGTDPYSTQGTLEVTRGDMPVAFDLIDNHLGGCEDFVIVP